MIGEPNNLIRLSALGFVMAAGAAFAAACSDSDARMFGAPDCRVEAPRDWNAGAAEWEGDCEAGFANGLGVVHENVDDLAPEVFLGRVENGYLRSGVVVTSSGYIAGTWSGGEVAPAGSDLSKRDAMIAAFRDAADAAEAARRSNGATSGRAVDYRALAERLRDQMD